MLPGMPFFTLRFIWKRIQQQALRPQVRSRARSMTQQPAGLVNQGFFCICSGQIEGFYAVLICSMMNKAIFCE